MRAGEARSSWGAATMQQVSDWLEKLGLGQYAPRFAENDISFAVLPDLRYEDLKEIGVSAGHRRQLVRAITELAGREKIPPKAAIAAPRDTAERRQVTVMFSDLVGSTALSGGTLIVSDGTAIRNPSQFRQCSAHLQRSGRQLDLQHRTRRRRVVAVDGPQVHHALHKVS